MSWKGRILGALIGIFFSPIGMIAGFIIGYYLYDRPKNILMQQNLDAENTFLGRGSKTEHKLLMQSTFRLMGYISRGAGRINESHIMHAEKIMDAMNLSYDMRKQAINDFNIGKSDDFDYSSEIDQLLYIRKRNPTLINLIIELLIGIAIADGKLESGEYERLINLAQALGIPPSFMERYIRSRLAEYQFRKFAEQFSQRNNNYNSYGNQSYENYERYGYDEQEQSHQNSYTQNAGADELAQAYEILGVTPQTPWNEIKRTHKKLMLKYHPDRLAQQGLPPEMIASFTEKAQSIQAAYNLIKSVRGES